MANKDIELNIEFNQNMKHLCVLSVAYRAKDANPDAVPYVTSYEFIAQNVNDIGAKVDEVAEELTKLDYVLLNGSLLVVDRKLILEAEREKVIYKSINGKRGTKRGDS